MPTAIPSGIPTGLPTQYLTYIPTGWPTYLTGLPTLLPTLPGQQAQSLAVPPSAYVMQISNDPSFKDAQTEPFSATKQWLLTAGDGQKTVYARFAPVGTQLWTQPVSDSIILDTVAPETFISQGPAEGSTVPTHTVVFKVSATDNPVPTPLPPQGKPRGASSNTGLSFSYQLDGTDWSDFSSTDQIKLTGLANGKHLFKVRAMDAAGNIDATPAQRGFIVQVTQPVEGQPALTFQARLEGRGTDHNDGLYRLVARGRDYQLSRQASSHGAMEGEPILLPENKFTAGTGQTFLLKRCGYLQRRQDITLQPGLNSLDFGTLKAGDILGNDQYGGEIGDNEVNVLDYSRLVSLFEGNDACADFNGDGLVEVLDYSLMLNNFDVKGEMFNNE